MLHPLNLHNSIVKYIAVKNKQKAIIRNSQMLD